MKKRFTEGQIVRFLRDPYVSSGFRPCAAPGAGAAGLCFGGGAGLGAAGTAPRSTGPHPTIPMEQCAQLLSLCRQREFHRRHPDIVSTLY